MYKYAIFAVKFLLKSKDGQRIQILAAEPCAVTHSMFEMEKGPVAVSLQQQQHHHLQSWKLQSDTTCSAFTTEFPSSYKISPETPKFTWTKPCATSFPGAPYLLNFFLSIIVVFVELKIKTSFKPPGEYMIDRHFHNPAALWRKTFQKWGGGRTSVLEMFAKPGRDRFYRCYKS